ncbi:50S ribosomal protein L11 methyltransferase [Facilibium subflavum]|uniref:50S ribosomal protein L11 methyltransferase n=1 Tax=Facilibium subflavum TaxID=2219058 RepID=UPI0013C3225B|nr:50S ribosomal protein L11 methyltransferase [Facilibium subflavum]
MRQDTQLKEKQLDFPYPRAKATHSWLNVDEALLYKMEWREDSQLSKSGVQIPKWHFAMLNDAERNDAYQTAIASIDLQDKVVIDIGCGTGLLSMMAIDHGARHVYAFECDKQIAQKAHQIILTNGYQNKITIIDSKSSEGWHPSVEKGDVLITETMDCGLVGEGILESIFHAKEHLLKSEASILPGRAKVFAAMVNSKDLHQLNHITKVGKWDLSAFNSFSTKGHFPVRSHIWDYTFASTTETLFSFEFQNSLTPECKAKCSFVSQVAGEVHGIMLWFEVELSNGVYLQNSPQNLNSHWMQGFISFEQPILVSQGQTLEFEIEYQDFTYVLKNTAAIGKK